jgi:hypothetical protein
MSRPRGVIVRRLNPDALLAEIKAVMPEEHRPRIYGEELFLLETPDLFAVIGTEGVGHFSTDGETCRVLFTWDGMQYDTAELRIAHIRLCETSGEVDLADAIRTFGSRLDANHHEWYRRATVKAVS